MKLDFLRHAPVGALLRLAGPVALARLGVMAMGIVDTVVVGQLAPRELPFLALGWSLAGVFLVGGMGLLTSVQVLAARVIGEGRPSAAGAVLWRGLALALGYGAFSVAALIVFGEAILRAFGVEPALAEGGGVVMRVLALSLPLQFLHIGASLFLEALRRPAAGMVIVWAANAANLALNLLLVPSLGAEGSAWATFLSRLLMLAAIAAWVWLSPTARAHGSRDPRAEGPGYRALLAVGLAAAVSLVAEAGAFAALTIIAGRISAEAVAAHQIALNTLSVIFMIAMGMSTATAVLVSGAIGRGDRQGAARAGWTGLALNTAAMIVAGVVVYAFRFEIARAFTTDEALILVLAGVSPFLALTLLPDGGQVVTASALRARGDNWFPTASHIFAYVLLMPPLAFYLAEMLGRGVAGLMQAVMWASVVSVAVLIARFWALGRAPVPAAPVRSSV